MLEKKMTVKVGGNYEPIPMGVYTVQIVDVNLINQMNPFKGITEDKLNYQMAVLDDLKMEDGSSTRNRYLWIRCSMVLSQKSWLLKLAKAVLGRELTKDEMDNFDPEALVGKQVMAMVEQKPSKDGTAIFNNILSFNHCAKELEKVEFEAKPSVIEKSSTPITMPEDDADPDKVIKELESKK